MNISSRIVLALGLLLAGSVILGTFYHNYDYTRGIYRKSFELQPVGLSDIKNLRGNLVSLQSDFSNMPVWILSGRWKLDTPQAVSNDSGIRFNANITMVGTNGTGEHRHRLVDFKPFNVSFNKMSAILNGTISLTTSGTDPSRIAALISNIPVSIKIENIRTVIVNLDKTMVNNHFGKFPIYGTVSGVPSN